MRRLFLLGAVFVLLGAGCLPNLDFNRKVTDVNPFDTESVSRARRLELTRSIGFENGLTLMLRPTFLGISGTVADVLGDENGRMEATLDLSDGSAFVWSRTDERETEASKVARKTHISEEREGAPPAREFRMETTEGRLVFARDEDDRKMLLPAFWRPGETLVEGNGVLWLPRDAHRRLKQGQKVEWRLGLGSHALDTASDILNTFRETVKKLFGDDGEEELSPFALKLVTEDGLFAVRVDGKMETLEVLQAKSWFADYLILDNPENPLILKVSVNPVAERALDAFSVLGVDTKALGYEITEIRSSD